MSIHIATKPSQFSYNRGVYITNVPKSRIGNCLLLYGKHCTGWLTWGSPCIYPRSENITPSASHRYSPLSVYRNMKCCSWAAFCNNGLFSSLTLSPMVMWIYLSEPPRLSCSKSRLSLDTSWLLREYVNRANQSIPALHKHIGSRSAIISWNITSDIFCTTCAIHDREYRMALALFNVDHSTRLNVDWPDCGWSPSVRDVREPVIVSCLETAHSP